MRYFCSRSLRALKRLQRFFWQETYTPCIVRNGKKVGRPNWLGYALLSTAAVVAIQGCSKAELEIVRIGVAVPLTGQYAAFGFDIKRAVELAVEEANTGSFIVNGRKVKYEVVTYDDRGQTAYAPIVAKRLVSDGVKAVIGHFNSGTSIAASEVYSEAGVPQITPTASDVELTRKGSTTTFRVIPGNDKIGACAAGYVLHEINPKRIVVVDDKTVFGVGLADEFLKNVAEKSARRMQIEEDGKNALAVVQSIRTIDPDFIFFGGGTKVAALLARHTREHGISAPIMSSEIFTDDNFIISVGKGAEGILNWRFGLPPDQMQHRHNFDEKYRVRFGIRPVDPSPFAYDAAKVVIMAMEAAKSVEPNKFLPAIRNTHYQGITGSISFSTTGDLKHWTVTLYELRKGRWETRVVKTGASD